MKDKLKGLLLGLVLGMLLSGTFVFAAGTQIEVAFKELKFMVDGVEKEPSDGKAFIYEDRTYVPYRFVSESLGQRVEWDEEKQTIWIGKIPDKIVASFDGGEVTWGQFDQYLSIQTFLTPSYQQYADDPAFQEYVMQQLIRDEIMYQRLTEQEKSEVEAAAETQIAQWMQSGQQQGGFLQSLEAAGLKLEEMESFLQKNQAMRIVLDREITDQALQERYEQMVEAAPEAYSNASVRHILIGLQDPADGSERTKEEALALAQEIRKELTDGSDFAELAMQYSEDPGSRENGGLYADTPVSNWVPAFKNAVLELPLGEISDPVETSYGYHLIKVEARSVQSLEQLNDTIYNQLLGEKVKFFMEMELSGLIEHIDLPE